MTLDGQPVTRSLPGRQGRLVFAYLACNRRRAVTRDELIDVLWPAGPPANPEDVLGALLSKLRRVLGPGLLQGRRELMLVLPAEASIDLELAAQAGGGRAGGGRREAGVRSGPGRCRTARGGVSAWVRGVVGGGPTP